MEKQALACRASKPRLIVGSIVVSPNFYTNGGLLAYLDRGLYLYRFMYIAPGKKMFVPIS